MRRILLLASLALAAAALAGCGSSSSSSSGDGTATEKSGGGGGGNGQTTIAGVRANDHGRKAAEDNGKTEVELDDYYFEPTVIEGKAGETVTLELKNEGQTEHTFTIESQSVDNTIAPGDEMEVTVTIPKSGVVSFYCKLHKSEGMAGALAVTGASTGGSSTNEDDDNGSDDGY